MLARTAFRHRSSCAYPCVSQSRLLAPVKSVRSSCSLQAWDKESFHQIRGSGLRTSLGPPCKAQPFGSTHINARCGIGQRSSLGTPPRELLEHTSRHKLSDEPVIGSRPGPLGAKSASQIASGGPHTAETLERDSENGESYIFSCFDLSPYLRARYV